MLEGGVEGFEHAAEGFGDGLANRGAHHREQRVSEDVRVATDGFAQRVLNRGSEGFG